MSVDEILSVGDLNFQKKSENQMRKFDFQESP